MHTPEEKHRFTLLRVQGWSIAKISAHLNIPKATIWRWDHDDREVLPILKAARFEELQEKYVPTYEEELQQLTAYRDRIRKALGDLDFSAMKPEFLLQMDLQISARLAKFRANLGLHSIADEKPVSLPGCLSRTEVPYKGLLPYDDPTVEGEADRKQQAAANGSVPANASPVHTAPANPMPLDPGHIPNSSSDIGHSSFSGNGTFRDKTPPGSKRAASAPRVSDLKNGTVPLSELIERVKVAAQQMASETGKEQSPSRAATASPDNDEDASTHSSLDIGHSSFSQNGTFRDKTPPGSKRDGSASTISNGKNGTVPSSRNGKLAPSQSEGRATATPIEHPAS